ncbi:hypothetical protein GGS23DRAFT_220266 [Durotheca rogersii]|uniref:uncharacterized protein n=1 Tax=Durotheca rogersii TaxID=419775 RepID=UPI002220B496|nr:uncharacterized protein GGS23DRAFT_220266 [Durotheca rogersii]KAI5860681.1 hypothetical protein GGS23DRAFT_220266 [Durotheca rogersii]
MLCGLLSALRVFAGGARVATRGCRGQRTGRPVGSVGKRWQMRFEQITLLANWHLAGSYGPIANVDRIVDGDGDGSVFTEEERKIGGQRLAGAVWLSHTCGSSRRTTWRPNEATQPKKQGGVVFAPMVRAPENRSS